MFVNRGSSPSLKEMEKKIQNLQNQVNSLQDRIRDLETTLGIRNMLLDHLTAPNFEKYSAG